MKNKRKKLWKDIMNCTDTIRSIRLGDAIKSWYAENDSKVFKGNNGFIFLKNEVFGSDDNLFESLYNTINPILKN